MGRVLATIYKHHNIGHRITNKNKIETFYPLYQINFSSQKIQNKLHNICMKKKNLWKVTNAICYIIYSSFNNLKKYLKKYLK